MSTSLHVRFGWRLRAAQGQRLTFAPRVSQGAGHSGGLMLFPGTAVVSSCSWHSGGLMLFPGTAVVSSCPWHSGGLMLFPVTAVVSCCSRGQRWSHAVPGTVVVPPGVAGGDKKRCCCSGSAQRVEGWLGMDVSPRLAPPLTTCWSLGLDLPSCKDDYSFTTRWE